ncbi:Acyl-protein thioesterase 1 [Symbiodinium microadriaticum]|uniref:Acyl-protein thioesterase 1 n=1 Tax=Symbiodinium microadriaticum TaxID=2951 RepID=A0A1Q9EHM8_SYMMI|nr:Acyl-protein thioesterase 1 [Symbiodinium microadriaticum]CAE7658157.1 unnamed protein product [Symbiodinium microadriaticum]CAE7946819.1 unnamed protein product [Symbiodinium sp. KB8]
MEDQEPQEEGSEQPGHLAAKSPPSPEDLLAQDIANLWLAAPGYQVSSAVIWLHHQGESEAMQEMLFRNFQLPEEVGRVRWLWPRAPLQPSSIRGHSPTLQWFDVKEYPICRVVRAIPDRARKGEDEHDVSAAVKRAETMVRALEVEGIPRRRILLGGFGQGAALVLRTVLQSQEPFAGGVVCSGWVAGSSDVPDNISEGGKSTALLWCHGARDDVVEPRLAAEQAKALKEKAEVNLRFVLFPEMQFELASRALQEIQRFVTERLLSAAEEAKDAPEGALDPG